MTQQVSHSNPPPSPVVAPMAVPVALSYAEPATVFEWALHSLDRDLTARLARTLGISFIVLGAIFLLMLAVSCGMANGQSRAGGAALPS